MKVRAVEHRDVGQRPALVDEPLDALDHERRLFARVQRLHQVWLLVIGARRAQFLVKVPALGLGGEHAVREGKDRRRGAIVGLDAVNLGLERVGVLVLVDQRVAEALLEVGRHVRRGPEQLEPVFQEVVVIDDRLPAFALAVGRGEPADQTGQGFVLRVEARDGLAQPALGVAREADDFEERAGARVSLVLEEHLVLFLDRLPQEAVGLLRVENGE